MCYTRPEWLNLLFSRRPHCKQTAEFLNQQRVINRLLILNSNLINFINSKKAFMEPKPFNGYRLIRMKVILGEFRWHHKAASQSGITKKRTISTF